MIYLQYILYNIKSLIYIYMCVSNFYCIYLSPNIQNIKDYKLNRKFETLIKPETKAKFELLFHNTTFKKVLNVFSY